MTTPLECSLCEYKTQQKSKLKRHIDSVHLAVTFDCPHCESTKSYKSQKNLEAHVKSVHEGKKFPCAQCNYRATSRKILQMHIRSIHDGQTFACKECNYEAKWKRTLERHIVSCIVWAPHHFRKSLVRRRRSDMSRTPGAPGVLVRRTAALRAGITGSRK